MHAAEIRQRRLGYFAKHDHHITPLVLLVSSSPSILFTVVGMVSFIPYILNTEPAPWPTAAPVQKYIRTSDIDNAGRTTRHGTFPQMNDNSSFGDYFKKGAIGLAWDLLASSLVEGGYGSDGDRPWMTVQEGGAVSYNYWTRIIGLLPDHI